MDYRIGIDLGGTNIAMGLVGNDYEIIARQTIPTQRERAEQEILADIVSCVHALLKQTNLTIEEVKTVGIGVPGSANKRTGCIEFANNLSFGNTPFVESLSIQLGKQVLFENDANAAAWGEYLAGVGKGKQVKSLIALTIGTGIGGGFIINGEIQQGRNYAAAEFGHTVIETNGVSCNCGRKGCLEAYASATALINRTKQFMRKNPDSVLWELCNENLNQVEGKTVFDALARNDGVAKEVFQEYISFLGTGIVNLINIFQPDILCIGGGISNAKEWVLPPLEKMVAEQSYARCSKDQPQICIAQLKNDAGMIGAAFLEV